MEQSHVYKKLSHTQGTSAHIYEVLRVKYNMYLQMFLWYVLKLNLLKKLEWNWDWASRSTLQASARAKPPPNTIMTFQGILVCTVGQSSRAATGPGLVGSATTITICFCYTESSFWSVFMLEEIIFDVFFFLVSTKGFYVHNTCMSALQIYNLMVWLWLLA